MKTNPEKIFIKEFDYDLPQEKIALFPLAKRDDSRLLVFQNDSIKEDRFYNLSDCLPEGSLMILNDTRVIEARIFFQKSTGGIIEIFCLEPYDQSMEISLAQTSSVRWQCLIGGASKWKPGQVLQKNIVIRDQNISFSAKYISRQTDDFIIEFNWTPAHFTFADILHAAGSIPLPPYIKREVEAGDAERYQTIFSEQEGSVAAPTSALHFTEQVFEKLEQKKIHRQYITLHVGAGTFKPVKSETIADHHMHKEPFTVTLKTLEHIRNAGTLVAVGTTSLRTLESIYWLGVRMMHTGNKSWHLQQWEAYELDERFPGTSVQESLDHLIGYMETKHLNELHGSTSLMVVPGYAFRLVGALITNFHQPQSTLLLLVCAFIGESWKSVYQHALQNNYRFLSYGDSSLLWRRI